MAPRTSKSILLDLCIAVANLKLQRELTLVYDDLENLPSARSTIA